MNRVVKLIESFNLVIGVCLNSLLLFLIVKCSKPHLGNYRNLLTLFACNDIFLICIHAIVEPLTFSSGSGLGLFSQAFPDNVYSISLVCSCFTIPFTLMNINFLHRYWSVQSPNKVVLFSKPSFIALLSLYPLTVTSLWFIFCLHCDINAVSRAILEPAYLRSGSETRMGKGWLVLYLWDDVGWNTVGLTLIGLEGIIMSCNVILAAVLCSLTIHKLRVAKTFSPSYRALHLKVLRALFAQSIVPLLLVNIPYGIAITMPFLSSDDEKGRFDPWFTLLSCFPAWDAIVIVALMKDYREGMIAMLLKPNMVTQYSSTHHTSTRAHTMS